MRRVEISLAALGVIALSTALFAGTTGALPRRSSSARVRSVPSAGLWSKAEEVPGTSKLNVSGSADVSSVSCVSASYCAAGGRYKDGSGHWQAFVVNEVRGTWREAEEVPGIGKLNAGGTAAINEVSCTSAGNCAAGGYYTAGSGDTEAFVTKQVGGTWRAAEEVPGTAKLNTHGDATVNSVSCSSSGNCAAGGYYTARHVQAFVVNEVRGIWRAAEEVPGIAKLNTGGAAGVNSVSCSSAGNCAAGGYYTVGSQRTQAFVVNKLRGVWRAAEEVPGSGKLNAGVFAAMNEVSCASAGNCASGGYYSDRSGHSEAFVANQVGGASHAAEEVPGTAKLNTGGDAAINSVYCASAGTCAAGGYYTVGSQRKQAFVVDEVRGSWHTAEEVPGSGKLNTGGDATINEVSCSSAGNCAAGGYYTSGPDSLIGSQQAFIVNEVAGIWRAAEEVPGTAKLNTGGAAWVNSVSCSSAGNCAAGGYYTNGSEHMEAFVADYN